MALQSINILRILFNINTNDFVCFAIVESWAGSDISLHHSLHLLCVLCIAEKYRSVFHFDHFNAIQTKIVRDALTTSKHWNYCLNFKYKIISNIVHTNAIDRKYNIYNKIPKLTRTTIVQAITSLWVHRQALAKPLYSNWQSLNSWSSASAAATKRLI